MTGPLGEFEQLILVAVATTRKDVYGITIHEKAQEIAGKARVVSLGACYTTLMRLRHKRFLFSYSGGIGTTRGARRKTMYQITPLGMKALSESLAVSQRMLEEMRRSGFPLHDTQYFLPQASQGLKTTA